ncbi:winged helix-turn-helix transcriptional regulator [Actinospica sp. MGRD01-02]|uniref:Winged helix-turn-helix transcriptional regulator n=1 Tax=Actinospica acidithermotolerans TaxID=2828514 RepID=A0A941EI30_9ACTN|nr:metalloregulator ArsR/SmtB family transcription factor [Actinospica acidithermotolerans]MBR7831100.1 winged helix-turn-helix transcriptional regulator [Actinospica acidithermotolerans]
MSTDVFGALANPVRRRLLEGLREGPRSTGDLAGMFDLGRPAVSEHLAVLRGAGLVREEPRGRHRFYHLEAAPLAEVEDWLHPFERYWNRRLRALSDLLDEEDSR